MARVQQGWWHHSPMQNRHREDQSAQNSRQGYGHPESLFPVIGTLGRPAKINHGSFGGHFRRKVPDHIRSNAGNRTGPLGIFRTPSVLPTK